MTVPPPPPPAPPAAPGRGSLTARLVWSGVLVAAASVLVTGLVNLGTYREGARTDAQQQLVRTADLAAGLLGSVADGADDADRIRSLREQATSQGVVVDVVPLRAGAGRTLQVPFARADLVRLARGRTVSDTRQQAGRSWFVEGRPVPGRNRVVLLAQPVDRATALSALPRRRLVLPLLLGLLGGAGAGWLLARQTARPLARMAAAARRLAAGERDVRVEETGPGELAEVAGALNGLATALQASEARRRRFLTDVSHELRTPLTAVTGYAEGLADGVIAGERVPEAGRVILEEAGRLQHRVQDLLALARLESDDFRIVPAPADLAALVRTAALAWTPRAQARGVPLRVEVPPGELVVRTDAERVRQALDALLDNALRVLPAGAPLVLGCSPDAAGWVRVEVRDGGPGLAPADLAVAFERGALTERFRGDRPVGSGLGLALVAELAHRLGGVARARQAPEGGAAFALLLPAAPVTDG